MSRIRERKLWRELCWNHCLCCSMGSKRWGQHFLLLSQKSSAVKRIAHESCYASTTWTIYGIGECKNESVGFFFSEGWFSQSICEDLKEEEKKEAWSEGGRKEKKEGRENANSNDSHGNLEKPMKTSMLNNLTDSESQDSQSQLNPRKDCQTNFLLLVPLPLTLTWP